MSNEKDPDMARVQKALDELSEHFCSVHIFATRHENDGTVAVQRGVGNWFARRGQIAEWLVKRDEDSRIDMRENRKDDYGG